ncbi:MAG: glycosyltransferase [Candidatus Aenigmarchaeota archaeon]|nr:glycosyltransferase [Candidatus Aenigmarchaeota archaeon]MDW7997997.1 glycosyltransferase [Thermodesulfovibrio sp.]MDW8149187.1 glycosyltransferase [Candidatus Aenigmarchaeota archaeon]
MKTCIIIPTFKSFQVTSETVKKLLEEQTNKDFDIIIVDCGSEDYKNLKQIFDKNKRVFIIHCNRDLGGSGSFWLGMKFAYCAGYEIFILSDNDCFPLSVDLVDKVVGGVEVFKCVKPKDINRDEKHFAEIGVMHFLTLKRDIVEKVGFPRPEFFIFCDDVDYYKRLGEVKIVEAYYKHNDKISFDPYAFSSRLYYYVRNNFLLLVIDFINSKGLSKVLQISRFFTMLWRFMLPSLISEKTFEYIKFVLKSFYDAIELKFGRESNLKIFKPTFSKNEIFKYDFILSANSKLLENTKFDGKKLYLPFPSYQRNFFSYLRQFLRSYLFLFKFFRKKILLLDIVDYFALVTARNIKFMDYIIRPKPFRNMIFSAVVFPIFSSLAVIFTLRKLIRIKESRYLKKLKEFFDLELKDLEYEVFYCSDRSIHRISEEDFKWLKKSFYH